MSFETPLAIELGGGRAAFAAGATVLVLAAAAALWVEPGYRAVPLAALAAGGLVAWRTHRIPTATLLHRNGRWMLAASGRDGQAVEIVHAAYVEWPLTVVTLRLANGCRHRVLVRPGRLSASPRRRLRALLKAC